MRRRHPCARSLIRGNECIIAAFVLFLWGFRGFRFDRTSPIWRPIDPNAQRIAAETPYGATGGGNALVPEST